MIVPLLKPSLAFYSMSKNIVLLILLSSVCYSQQIRPNIIFIFSDDHDQRAISAYGNALIKTPNIDRIAQNGTVFENSFCTNSICAPSRAVILTGKHSHLNSVPDNRNETRFDSSQVTFPKILKENGYTTAIVGKWHLKSNPTGFDYWEILNDQGQYYNPEFISKEGARIRNGYATDLTTDLAINFLKDRDKSKPFLLMCQNKAPHRNFMPKIKYIGMYDSVLFPLPATFNRDYTKMGSAAQEQKQSIAKDMMPVYDLKLFPAIALANSLSGINDKNPYFAWLSEAKRLNPEEMEKWVNAYMPRQIEFLQIPKDEKSIAEWKFQSFMRDYMATIYSVDENVGRLLDYLDQNNLAQNTIVVYSSDQGFWLGENGWFDKRFMFEKSMRMPLIVKWPGVTDKNKRVTQMVQNLDYAQTFLEMAGIKSPSDMQGKSLVPLLKDPNVQWDRDYLYYQYFEYPDAHRVQPHYGIRSNEYKLIYFPLHNEWEFYNLKADPDEQYNLIGESGLKKTIAIHKLRLNELRKQYLVKP